MDTIQVARLCALGGLGEPTEQPQAVSGGLLHRMWKITTSRGRFAVKELHAEIMRKPGIQDAYRLSEQIAAALAAEGIPAVAALPDKQGDVLYSLDQLSLLVYPWVDGVTLPVSSIDPERARQMGIILARIHALHLDISSFEPLEWGHFNDEDWDALTFQASELELPWTYRVRSALPHLLQWTRNYEQAGLSLGQRVVVSHRDLDQKNVLWQDATTPWLIDWEAAGLINPTMELMSVALYWSGIVAGTPDETAFSAVLDDYVEAGGVIEDAGQDAVYGFMGTWLGWLLFNMRRSLGESVVSVEEQELGIRETLSTLAILQALETHGATWAALVDARR
ncbi:phosphotransferase [Dictyobacter arantiisoli]|uniref:Membrane protein n=1 Tax=Dictyobacter arantiisoli TaxID=2014874 RepID=A0A5A5TDF4_9CHLR|nr:phosphotransferase [Dictyobacter arantiisoli]GCF09387.1 membrane protein [Dictyobacter arantiisoli]